MFGFKRNEKYASIAFYAFLAVSAAAVVIVGILNFSSVTAFIGNILSVLSPFTYGFVFAYLCNPIMVFFEEKLFAFKKSKRDMHIVRRALSLILTILTVLALVSVLLYAVIPQTVGSYEELGSQLGGYISNIQTFADGIVEKYSDTILGEQYDTLSSLLAEYDISFSIKDILSKSYSFLQNSFDYIIGYGGKIVGQVINIVMGMIVAVYFLISKDTICAQSKKLLAAVTTRRGYMSTVRLARYTHKTFGGFIVGKIIDSVIVGFLTFIVLMIFKVPYYPLLSVIIGIMNIVPTFGPIIGGAFGGLLVLIVDPGKLIMFIIIVLIIQQIDGNIIDPKIIGSSLGISSLWVVIAIIAAGGFFGFLGMVVGVPITAVIYVLVKQWTEKKLRHKNMPYHTEFYKTDPSPTPDDDAADVFIEKDAELDSPTLADDTPDKAEPEKKKRSLTDIIKGRKVKKTKGNDTEQ